MAARKAKKDTADKRSPSLRIAIEELSRRSGFTVRNIRELHRRKLIASPELEGRKGYYGAEHLDRLALIRRMQDRGYSLSGVGDLLKTWERGNDIDDVLGMGRDLRVTLEKPGAGMRSDALWAALPELRTNAALRAKAVAIELIVPEGRTFTAPSAELVHVVRTFVDAGMALSVVLDDMIDVHEDVERIMARARRSFVATFVRSQSELADLTHARELAALVAKLRPPTVRAVTLMLEQAAQRGAPLPPPPPKRARRATKG